MAFSANDWNAFLPETILVLFALLVTLLAAWVGDNPKGRQLVRQTVLLAYALALVAVLVGQPERSELFNGLFVSGGVLSWFKGLVLAGAFAAGWMTTQKWDEGVERAEYPLLVLLATLGMCLMISANDLMALYMGLELQSLPLFVIAAMRTRSLKSSEAGLKYFLLGALSSGMLLYGASLIYGFVGTTSFTGIAETLAAGPASAGVTVGLVFLLSGLAFKISAAPFHMWTPDVYEGAPVPVTAYLATVSKAAMLAVTMRLILASNALDFTPIVFILTLMAAASMILGNLLAVMQENVKRLFAYSSIAHLGYLMIVVIASAGISNAFAVEAMSFYMLGYFLMSIAGFAVISAISDCEQEMDCLEDFRGMFWRNSWLSTVLITVLLSLAGIPLTAGFIGKFYILSVGVEDGLWFLMSMLIVGSAIGLYYYLRLIYIMLQKPEQGTAADRAANSLPVGINVVMAAMTLGIIYLGIYPAPMIATIQSLASAF